MSQDEIFNSCQRAYDAQLPPNEPEDEDLEDCPRCKEIGLESKMQLDYKERKTHVWHLKCDICGYSYWDDPF